MKDLDGVIGRIWTGIEKSPLAEKTALFLISDHGFNTDPQVYSQGFNLVHLLGSREGGGHHVITKRRLMLDYAIKSIYPLVPLITTTTDNTYYLKGQSTEYPTVLLDFDGNERSSIHLRDSDLNEMQILLQELRSKRLSPAVQSAATDEFFRLVEQKRPAWRTITQNLTEQLGALERWIIVQQALIAAQPKKWTPEQRDLGLDQDARRVFARMDSARSDLISYREYLAQMQRLLTLERSTFAPRGVKIQDLIPPRFMGDRNSVHDLQNYVVGLAPNGLTLSADGKLDRQNCFVRLNYFDLLLRQTVRNNVQSEISNRPIDFTAVRIPREQLAGSLTGTLRPDDDVVWVYGGPDKQALILARTSDDGRLSLRYLPISDLRQAEDGSIRFYLQEWSAGFPLHYFEDPNLNVPVSERAQWLSEWHTDVEWLRAVHKTHYSNGLIGLHEQMVRHALGSLDADQTGLTTDERLLRRFRSWQRNQTETDMLILANNHWNFDVRGFNPGGNHGSFFRISTNSAFMVAGGTQTGVPRGMVVNEPYDSLTFIPTVLGVMGRLEGAHKPFPIQSGMGVTGFPGRVATEVVKPLPGNSSAAGSH